MSYVLGIAVGIVWGGIWAALNCFISLKAIRKNTNKAVLTMNFARIAIDVMSLGIVFLLRNRLPFDPYMCLVGTAVTLSVVTIVFAFRAAGGKIK